MVSSCPSSLLVKDSFYFIYSFSLTYHQYFQILCCHVWHSANSILGWSSWLCFPSSTTWALSCCAYFTLAWSSQVHCNMAYLPQLALTLPSSRSVCLYASPHVYHQHECVCVWSVRSVSHWAHEIFRKRAQAWHSIVCRGIKR